MFVKKRQDQPFPSKNIDYGAKKQHAKQQSNAPLLDKEGKLFIQKACGKFLFLGRAVGSTLLCSISANAPQSAAPTENTMNQTLQLLNYIATQEGAVLMYNASNMKLALHSNANYLRKQTKNNEQNRWTFLFVK